LRVDESVLIEAKMPKDHLVRASLVFSSERTKETRGSKKLRQFKYEQWTLKKEINCLYRYIQNRSRTKSHTGHR